MADVSILFQGFHPFAAIRRLDPRVSSHGELELTGSDRTEARFFLFQESKPAEGGDAGSEYIKLKVVGQVRTFFHVVRA